MQNVRKVKVQEVYTPGTQIPPRPARRAPKLTLAGLWLALAGFTAGTTTEIEVNDGLLVVRRAGAPAVEETPTRTGWENEPVTGDWADVREELTIYRH